MLWRDGRWRWCDGSCVEKCENIVVTSR
ncbi:unnamed protein product [Spirodela intermedia]|uniref:Uncharacterized protein n=2 Tax=Spirodela intermedia TaxID=51605 RepID=A0A7I8K0L9_SPIIN|nr:unnamed protein product [Spirodela intermedia]CAA6655234.1 unnamed protein product [Spirodela intermedia]CAA7390421.1 unnamed protein product [Spirodela intermedia]